VAAMFMINDIEDAPDDALSPHKAKRNAVANGMLSRRGGWMVTTLAALLSGFLFSLLGFWPAVWGWFSLLLGYLYSWRKIRLKNVPVLDVLTHCMMLAGCQFLTAFYTFSPGIHWWWPFPFIMTVTISMYGELFNELRDYQKDHEAGLNHTAILLGYRRAMAVMHVLLGVGIISTVITLLGVWIVPLWVLLLTAAVFILIMIPIALRMRRTVKATIDVHAPVHKPLEISFAIAFSIWYVLPWIGDRIGVWVPQ
jgi:4-hydroxybenzoate polyprenyltransferase